MELLILKTGTDYIRIKDDTPVTVRLDKASVFPMSQMEYVRRLKEDAVNAGFKDVRIKKLRLTEEDL